MSSGEAMDVSTTDAAVDEGLYSRQLYVMGFEAQRRLGAADVLIYGMNGLGAETAKNIILAGVRRVDVMDDRPVSFADLAAHFYCTEADVGRPRAAVTAPKLAELNPHVAVSVVSGTLSHEVVSRYSVVVLIDLPSEAEAVSIADFCHDRGIAVITADAPGVFGRVFCDFGASFTVHDVDGEAAVSGVIASVTPISPGSQETSGNTSSASSSSGSGTAGTVKLLIHAPEDMRHQLASGDVVELTGFQPQQQQSNGGGAGISSTPLSRLLQRLNGQRLPVVVRNANSFEIEVQDEEAGLASSGSSSSLLLGSASTTTTTGGGSASTSNLLAALVNMGGYFKQIKQPATVHFQRMSEVLSGSGDVIQSDVTKADRARPLHLAFRALAAFRAAHNWKHPRPGNAEDAEEVYRLACALNNSNNSSTSTTTSTASEGEALVSDLAPYRRLITRFAMCSAGSICPLAAMAGGVVAQEVLKAASGKFMPVRQWMYLDNLDALSPEPLPEDEVTPYCDIYNGTSTTSGTMMSAAEASNARYDGLVMVLGRRMQQMLHSQSAFLVGAGAIGCEMLKNWALMGVACNGGGGTIHVTDMDRIERSNLSRQFLFRNADIHKPKSLTAAAAATAMNNSMKCAVYEDKVAVETEHVFNDDFYESLDFVCTALDNVEARLYVDQKCLFHHLPLLESGTLGTKCHTQVVVPGLTESYGATRDPPEKSIPMCTLKHFPNLIEHTIQWAREWFEEVYKQTAVECNMCVQTGSVAELQTALSQQQNLTLDTLRRMLSSLVSDRPRSFEDCVRWARLCFEDLFNHRIQQLLHNYPLDRLTQSGLPFWSGAKKPPKILNFDPSDATHLEFVLSAALMRSKLYGISAPVRPSSGSSSTSSSLEDEAEEQEAYLRDITRRVASSLTVPAFRPSEAVRYAIVEEEEEKKNQQLQAGASSSSNSDGEPPAKRAAGTSSSAGAGGGDQFDMDCKPLLDALAPVVGSVPSSTASTTASISASSTSGHGHGHGPQLLTPVDFEKDDDGHMRVVAACANLRARNYGIMPEADLHTARGIAGKITPAISTSTAFAAGAICLEMFKILMPQCGWTSSTSSGGASSSSSSSSSFATSKYAGVDVASLSNTFSNLAVPLFATMQPEPPRAKQSVRSGKPYSFTPWDRIDIDPTSSSSSTGGKALTLRGLMTLLQKEHGLRLLMLSSGVSILYSDFMSRKKAEERMDMSIRDVLESVSKAALPSVQKYLLLEVIAEDVESEEQIDLPYMRVKIR